MYLSIDIGGTKTLLALYNWRGRKLKSVKFLTDQDPEKFIFYLSEHLSVFLSPKQKRKLKAVTMACPSVITKNGQITPDNLPQWHGFALQKSVTKLFSPTPVFLVNDASLAALYESKGKKGKSVYLTFSTGIGGGLTQNGELLEESNTFEPGHVKYTWQGKKREWEDVASANALKRDYDKIATDLRGKKAMKDITERVSLGLPDIIKAEQPDYIIIGGALGIQFPNFHYYLNKELAATVGYPLPKLIKAKRPLESVIYGCYLYGKHHAKNTK